jgi:isopentenyl phosphate kinase
VIFLKLGGSAITDKTHESTPREDVIRRLAREIRNALDSDSTIGLLIGHGSGSFGHFAAKKYGFGQAGNWRAYVETGAAASRLARIVIDIFLEEGLPVVGMQPSASARCRDGELIWMVTTPIELALEHKLVPLVYGDVAFDETLGMAIASTEMIFAYLAPILRPSRIILAGIVDGVFTTDPLKDPSATRVREITPVDLAELRLGGSHGVDVTGGMLDKVKRMVNLVQDQPGIKVQVISAICEGGITRALLEKNFAEGTLIHS